MNFKPDGLKLPDCTCFKTKVAGMNRQIDLTTSAICIHVCEVSVGLRLCTEAKDYYIACIVSDVVQLLLNPNKGLGEQHKEFAEAYERIKPLVMQRLDYTDNRLEVSAAKFGIKRT